MAFQVRDMTDAMRAASAHPLVSLRADGGAAAMDLLLQLQAEQSRMPVARPASLESTGLGAATLAGLAEGMWTLDDLAGHWSSSARFEPELPAESGGRGLRRLAAGRGPFPRLGGVSPLDRSAWPELTLSEWEDTRDTLHLWIQVVGKVRLGLEPMLNHWWQVTLYVSAAGLTTSLMPTGDGRGLEIEFDFVDHVLHLQTTDERARSVPLVPQTVAAFYGAVMSALAALDVTVAFYPRPNEVADATPFPDDVVHRSYDPDAAQRFWRALVQADRVMRSFRARFLGKSSPVHLFWGAPDLAVTRFSGRPAPPHPGGVPNCPDRVQLLAYSHEVHSCGFWPGGSEEGSFYAYAYPQPDGFAEWPIAPDAAHYDTAAGEFILPYAAVRTAADPDATLLSFFQSSYEAAADLGHWDRAALEVDGPPRQ